MTVPIFMTSERVRIRHRRNLENYKSDLPFDSTRVYWNLQILRPSLREEVLQQKTTNEMTNSELHAAEFEFGLDYACSVAADSFSTNSSKPFRTHTA